jgi:hypothetical protein
MLVCNQAHSARPGELLLPPWMQHSLFVWQKNYSSNLLQEKNTIEWLIDLVDKVKLKG